MSAGPNSRLAKSVMHLLRPWRQFIPALDRSRDLVQDSGDVLSPQEECGFFVVQETLMNCARPPFPSAISCMQVFWEVHISLAFLSSAGTPFLEPKSRQPCVFNHSWEEQIFASCKLSCQIQENFSIRDVILPPQPTFSREGG